jgi:Tol biopolymer transport system component
MKATDYVGTAVISAWSLLGFALGCSEPLRPPTGSLTIRLAPTGSGDGQTDTIGGTLVSPLRALVLRGQTPAQGVAVSWTTTAGSISPARSTTDASGIALAAWTLGDTAGQQSATASVPNQTVANDTVPLDVSFNAIAQPGTPVALVFGTGPTNAFVGRPLIPSVAVAAVDRRSNVATGFNGRTVLTLGTNPGGASLSGTTANDAVKGVAAFVDLSLDHPGAGYTLTASASGLRSVTSAAFEIVAPGSGQIAFWSTQGGNPDIYVMNADGSGQVNLTGNPATDWEFAWSPDGSQIAFATARDGNWDIYVMSSDGTGLRALTNNSGTDVLPAWSPDGSKIAYLSDRDGPLGIFVMNADGSSVSRLTTSGVGPAWSPDGSKIAFTDSHALYVMNSDGSGVVKLDSVGVGSDLRPAWSPDGTKIAFVRYLGNCRQRGCRPQRDIYVMNADGSGLVDVTNNRACDLHFAWSPDGSQIAFAGNGGTYNGVTYWGIYTVHGSAIVRLTSGGISPAWDPDGLRIVFSNGDAYVMRTDGSGLVDLHAAGSEPAWKPR